MKRLFIAILIILISVTSNAESPQENKDSRRVTAAEIDPLRGKEWGLERRSLERTQTRIFIAVVVSLFAVGLAFYFLFRERKMFRVGHREYRSRTDLRYIEDYYFLMPWRYFFTIVTVTLVILGILIHRYLDSGSYFLLVPSLLLTHYFIKIYWDRTDGGVIPRRLPFHEEERALPFKDIRIGRIIGLLLPYIAINIFITLPVLAIAYAIVGAVVR